MVPASAQVTTDLTHAEVSKDLHFRKSFWWGSGAISWCLRANLRQDIYSWRFPIQESRGSTSPPQALQGSSHDRNLIISKQTSGECSVSGTHEVNGQCAHLSPLRVQKRNQLTSSGATDHMNGPSPFPNIARTGASPSSTSRSPTKPFILRICASRRLMADVFLQLQTFGKKEPSSSGDSLPHGYHSW